MYFNSPVINPLTSKIATFATGGRSAKRSNVANVAIRRYTSYSDARLVALLFIPLCMASATRSQSYSNILTSHVVPSFTARWYKRLDFTRFTVEGQEVSLRDRHAILFVYVYESRPVSCLCSCVRNCFICSVYYYNITI